MVLNNNMVKTGKNFRVNDDLNSNSFPQNECNNRGIVGKIKSLKHGAFTLTQCLSSIQQISQFLSHNDENIRKTAASALASVIDEASKLLMNETDANNILQVSKQLIKFIEKLEKSGVNVSPEISNTIKGAKERIINKLIGLLKPDNQDQFVSNDCSSEISGLCDSVPGNKLQNKLNKAVNSIVMNLIGKQNFDEFKNCQPEAKS